MEQAYKAQRPAEGLLHHSDRGSQYASSEYRERLKKYGMNSSMSRKGNCYDNACIESFHSLLKRELRTSQKISNSIRPEQGIYWYIEFFYNLKRIHSSLGYLSPDRFESQYYRSKTA
ncbi:DDE-type integrase/transposase/recombinase [Paenibacillus thiaminolyticus]|nr:DDE-type integrase/transposase/recombinase [Paenibacillus thiaminolyticus]